MHLLQRSVYFLKATVKVSVEVVRGTCSRSLLKVPWVIENLDNLTFKIENNQNLAGTRSGKYWGGWLLDSLWRPDNLRHNLMTEEMLFPNVSRSLALAANGLFFFLAFSKAFKESTMKVKLTVVLLAFVPQHMIWQQWSFFFSDFFMAFRDFTMKAELTVEVLHPWPWSYKKDSLFAGFPWIIRWPWQGRQWSHWNSNHWKICQKLERVPSTQSILEAVTLVRSVVQHSQ